MADGSIADGPTRQDIESKHRTCSEHFRMLTSEGKTEPRAISSSEVIWDSATADLYSMESGMVSAEHTYEPRRGRGEP